MVSIPNELDDDLIQPVSENWACGYGGRLIPECVYTKLTPLLSDLDDDEKDDKFYVVISDYSKSGLMNMNGKVLFKPGFGFIEFRKQVNLFPMGPNGYSGF